MDTEQEQKTPAELKEIRLARKAAQEAEGVKAMADIAAADVAIRKRTEELRALRLARKPKNWPTRPNPNRKLPEKENELMPTDDKATKSERDAAAKAVLDNMARLKAMRLAREAVSPPRRPRRGPQRNRARRLRARHRRANRRKKHKPWQRGSPISAAAAAGPDYRRTCFRRV